MLEGDTLDVFFNFAIPECYFKGNELPLLEDPGEFREIAPGIDAVPLGAGLVVALVVLPALLGSEIEDDVLAVVLGCLRLCMLSEAADESAFVEYGVWLRFFLVCPLSAVHACPTGVPSRPTPSATGRDLRKGTSAYVMVRRPLHFQASSGG